ncbi:MAG: hypothetical protein ACYTFG_08165 [Planctomycetota bacterium]|jgi:hypothetical protein
MLRKAGITISVLFLLASGCGVSEPLLVGEDLQIRELKKQVTGRGWTLHPGEITVDSRETNGGEDWALSVDTELLQEEVLQALARAGVFRDVVMEPGSMGGKEHALLLSMRVVEAKGKSLGKNGSYVPNLFLWWLLSPFAASYVADEDFEGTLTVEVALEEPGKADPVWKGRVTASFEASLDHFQRGITLLDLLPTGVFTASTDPEDVSEVLGPHLYRKIEVQLIGALSKGLPKPEIDLLVGVGSGRGLAEADVKAFVDRFEKRAGRMETMVHGSGLPVSRLRSALHDMASRQDVTIRDILFFYAGPGTLSKTKKGVEASITPTGSAEDAMTVSELCELIKAVPAKSRTLILDSGFAGKAGRAVPPVKGVDASKVLPFVGGKNHPCLLSAAGPGEAGFESESWKHGALTAFLLPNLAVEADEGGDGNLMASEVFSEVMWNLHRKVRLAGGTVMTPRLVGDGVIWRYAPAKKPEKPRKKTGPAKKGGAGKK